MKGCVPVSTFSSPDVDGGSSLSLCEALTQLLCWHMPLEVRWGETGHDACSEESTVHVLSQCWRSAWSPLCILVTGEQLSSGVRYQTECITSSAPRAQDRELTVKLYPLHPSSYLGTCQNSFQTVQNDFVLLISF